MKVEDIDLLTQQVIGCAIEVHRQTGPGLLESTYEQCLSYELRNQHIRHALQKEMPISYKGIALKCGYRADLLVEDCLLIELKAVDKILPVHEAQVLTYMKPAGVKIGLLINFNEKLLKDGIKRFVL